VAEFAELRDEEAVTYSDYEGGLDDILAGRQQDRHVHEPTDRWVCCCNSDACFMQFCAGFLKCS